MIENLIIKAIEELKEKKQEENKKLPRVQQNKEIDTKKNQQALIKFIGTNSENEVKELLEKGVNPNFILKERASLTYPLGVALTNKVINERMIKMLLDYGARDCLSKSFYEDYQADLVKKISENLGYAISNLKVPLNEHSDVNEIFKTFAKHEDAVRRIRNFFPLYSFFVNGKGNSLLGKEEYFDLFKDIDFPVIDFFIKTSMVDNYISANAHCCLFNLFLSPTVEAEYKNVMSGKEASKVLLLSSSLSGKVLDGATNEEGYSLLEMEPKSINKSSSVVTVNDRKLERLLLTVMSKCERETDLKKVIEALLKVETIGQKENPLYKLFNDKTLNYVWLKVLGLDAISCVELLCEKKLTPKNEKLSFKFQDVFENNYYSSYGAPSGSLEKQNGYGGFSWKVSDSASTSLLCYSFLVGASNCSAVFSQVPVLVKQMQESNVDNNYLVFSKKLLEVISCLNKIGYNLDLIEDKDGTNPMHQLARTSENKAMLQSCFKLNQKWLSKVNNEGKRPLDYWDSASKEKMMSMIDDSALRSQIGRKGKNVSSSSIKKRAL